MAFAGQPEPIEPSNLTERAACGPEPHPRISHAFLLTTAQLARGLARLVFVLVVARVLGPKQFGLYALLLATVEILAVASGSGYADFLTREAAKDPRLGWGLGWQLTLLRMLSSVALVAAGLGILWLLGYSQTVLSAAIWLCLTLVPRSISEAVQGVLRGIGRYATNLAVELVFDTGLIGGVVLLLARGGGLRTVIEAEIAAAALAALIAVVFAIFYRTKERIGLNARELFKKSAIFNVYAFLCNLYDRVDIVLLSKLAGDYATGVYSVAYRPLGTIQLVPYGVLYSLLPGLTRSVESKEELQRLERAMGFLLSAAFAIVLATEAFAEPAVRLLLGPRYADSAIALKILIWAVVLRYINYALNTTLLAAGLERVFVVTALVCLVVNAGANLLLIPKFTWLAAAAVTVLTELVLLGQNFYWLRRTLGAIPAPVKWGKTSLVFAGLLAALVAGAKVVAPLVAGSVCILLFITYLYFTGMINEFASAWGERSDRAVEGLSS